MILARANNKGSPPGQGGKGAVHLIGGIFAVNILGTIDILKATFGFLGS